VASSFAGETEESKKERLTTTPVEGSSSNKIDHDRIYNELLV